MSGRGRRAGTSREPESQSELEPEPESETKSENSRLPSPGFGSPSLFPTGSIVSVNHKFLANCLERN